LGATPPALRRTWTIATSTRLTPLVVSEEPLVAITKERIVFRIQGTILLLVHPFRTCTVLLRLLLLRLHLPTVHLRLHHTV
jgi:hypothetical protein